jgi:4-hydroxybutyrate CoA-transferase
MNLPPSRSAAASLSVLPVGSHLVSSPGMGAPGTVLAALGEVSAGKHWRLDSGLLLDDYPFLPAVIHGALTYRTWHVMPPVRDLVASGQVEYVPARASQLAGMLRHWRPDVAIVRVSPPDAGGYCSLGASVSYGRAALDVARHRIAEVDPAVPRTCGDSLVHVSTFDSLVESTMPVPEYRASRPSAVSTTIADRVLALLPHSPTLQIGIGGVPEALVRRLKDTDLGELRFVGMATDDMVDLFEAGRLRATDVVPAPAVLSPDMMGGTRLLKFSDGNPAIGMYPSAVSHDPIALSRIPRFVSINTAIEIDLLGNVNSEVINGRQISGTGGSLDYVETATRSAGGLRIVAVPSTSSDGSISRIVPSLGSVTIPRTMVDVIVTEYGSARLEGLSATERAEALVNIAHPGHRAALSAALAA